MNLTSKREKVAREGGEMNHYGKERSGDEPERKSEANGSG
jgi:hypothetical protein